MMTRLTGHKPEGSVFCAGGVAGRADSCGGFIRNFSRYIPLSVLSRYLAPVALALLCALALAGVASAQDAKPGPPANVQVSPTDTEAAISWDAPETAQGGCAATDYRVWVEKAGKCLGIRVAPVPPLLLWPSAFQVIDETGHVVADVGDEVQFSAFSVDYDQAVKHGGLENITPACSGPYWAVKEDFAATGIR